MVDIYKYEVLSSSLMCIINEPAHVSNTEILVSPSADQSRQLVVYTNKVKTNAKNNAMILPVPHPHTFELHDLSRYADIFEDCGKSFSQSFGIRSKGLFTLSANCDNETLKVHVCGSYNVSIVPSHRDFHRLDRNYFQLNATVGQLLEKYYDNTFGFIVCKLREGREEKYHPLAYSHQMYQPERMFVPTRHHHSSQEETLSHYDHNIYSINTKDLCGNVEWDHSFCVKTHLVPDFIFPEIVNFCKFNIHQQDLNTDMYFYLDSHIDSFGQYHGVDGCIFKTNSPAITFQNTGSIYIQPMYRGLPFVRNNGMGSPLRFAGKGTTFAVNGNRIKITDNVGTPDQYELLFTFDPKQSHLGVHEVKDDNMEWRC